MMGRSHHYVFAHIVLRQLFFKNPSAFVTALTSRGTDIVKRLWDDVGEKIAEDEGAEKKLPYWGLTCSTHDLGSGTIAVVVSLPPPEEVPEAHFVGFVLRSPRNKLVGLLGAGKPAARYITLEYGLSIKDGAKRTVLCEWRGDNHLNMGDGPEATLSAFVQKIIEMTRT